MEPHINPETLKQVLAACVRGFAAPRHSIIRPVGRLLETPQSKAHTGCCDCLCCKHQASWEPATVRGGERDMLTGSFNSRRSCLARGSRSIWQAAALLRQLAGTLRSFVKQCTCSITCAPCTTVCPSQLAPVPNAWHGPTGSSFSLSCHVAMHLSKYESDTVCNLFAQVQGDCCAWQDRALPCTVAEVPPYNIHPQVTDPRPITLRL